LFIQNSFESKLKNIKELGRAFDIARKVSMNEYDLMKII
jgi:hypothetical protein